MHWNSQPHIKREAEGGEEVKAAEEEVKTDAPTAVEGAAAADSTPAVDSTPDPVPTYETELKHQTVNHFKKSMGLFVDNYKLAYATTNFSL